MTKPGFHPRTLIFSSPNEALVHRANGNAFYRSAATLESSPRRHGARHMLVGEAFGDITKFLYTNTGRSSTLANMHVEGCMTAI
jgi:hypothetical protein